MAKTYLNHQRSMVLSRTSKLVGDISVNHKFLYSISRNVKTGDVELTIYEKRKSVTIEMSPQWARQMAKDLL